MWHVLIVALDHDLMRLFVSAIVFLSNENSVRGVSGVYCHCSAHQCLSQNVILTKMVLECVHTVSDANDTIVYVNPRFCALILVLRV